MVFRALFLLIHLKRDRSLFHLYRFGSFSFGFVSISSLLKVEKQVFCSMGYMFSSLKDIKDLAISRMEQDGSQHQEDQGNFPILINSS